jgi:hypothetical protein
MMSETTIVPSVEQQGDSIFSTPHRYYCNMLLSSTPKSALPVPVHVDRKRLFAVAFLVLISIPCTIALDTTTSTSLYSIFDEVFTNHSLARGLTPLVSGQTRTGVEPSSALLQELVSERAAQNVSVSLPKLSGTISRFTSTDLELQSTIILSEQLTAVNISELNYEAPLWLASATFAPLGLFPLLNASVQVDTTDFGMIIAYPVPYSVPAASTSYNGVTLFSPAVSMIVRNLVLSNGTFSSEAAVLSSGIQIQLPVVCEYTSSESDSACMESTCARWSTQDQVWETDSVSVVAIVAASDSFSTGTNRTARWYNVTCSTSSSSVQPISVFMKIESNDDDWCFRDTCIDSELALYILIGLGIILYFCLRACQRCCHNHYYRGESPKLELVDDPVVLQQLVDRRGRRASVEDAFRRPSASNAMWHEVDEHYSEQLRSGSRRQSLS